MASLAARAMSNPKSLSLDEIESLGASALASRREDFDHEDEVTIPTLGAKPVDDNVNTTATFLPEAEVKIDGEDETPISPSIIEAAPDLSPKVLTDAFASQMFGVVVPTRQTAVRMTEFVVGYLTDLARRRGSQ
jgi:hypothetical protein